LLGGKVALVTGSSRGIGEGIARLFAAHGAKVAVHGRDLAALASVRDSIEGTGGRAMAVAADATGFDEVEAMRRRIEDELGPVDVLVANAGGNPIKPGALEETSEEGWRAAIDGNLTATFLTIKAFLPGMKARRTGTIITMSSAAARRGHAGSPIAYAAAKAGVIMLTRHLAAQAGPYGIRVNCLAPETILTNANMRRIPEEQQKTMAAAHPLSRLGTVADVAQAALYLASARASWVTGVVLDVAGGAVMI
jgi:3-oxoacyl-[acyl-carrier protein] reductase